MSFTLDDHPSIKRDGIDHALERARRAWQESMSRQISELRAAVRENSPQTLAPRCGASQIENGIRLVYWNQPVVLTWPELEAHHEATGELCSIHDTAMLLYYLKTADGSPLEDRWISFRELPGGAFYAQAYQGYSGDSLVRAFGENVQAFNTAARKINGWPLTGLAANAYSFDALPRLRLAAVFWPGDDEFPSRASILFDAASSHYMTTDGLAGLGASLAHQLISAYRTATG